MESELNTLSSNPATPPHEHDDSTKDHCPLLPKSSDSSSASDETLQELEKKCAAYVRRDVYGTMGRGELPASEKILLGLTLITLVPVRIFAGMLILVAYYLVCRFCTLFSAPNRGDDEQEDYAHMGGWRRAAIVKFGRLLSRAMLFVMGFYRIDETYRVPRCHDKGANEHYDVPRLA
ncbi:hypothetical protein ACLOJK_002869 [Asimina triloba]